MNRHLHVQCRVRSKAEFMMVHKSSKAKTEACQAVPRGMKCRMQLECVNFDTCKFWHFGLWNWWPLDDSPDTNPSIEDSTMKTKFGDSSSFDLIFFLSKMETQMLSIWCLNMQLLHSSVSGSQQRLVMPQHETNTVSTVNECKNACRQAWLNEEMAQWQRHHVTPSPFVTPTANHTPTTKDRNSANHT